MTDDAARTLERVTDTVDYLRISVGADDTRDWIDCATLVADPDTLGELVRSTAADRGTDRDDVAMSLFVQGYAFRIASIVVGGWLLDGVVLDVSPGTTAIALGRNRPNAVRLDDVRIHQGGGDPLAMLHRTLVDGHLALLVANAHAACRVGERLLWSGVGAAFASSFGAFMAPLPDRWAEIRARIELFLSSARPELIDSGRVAHVGTLWAWERSACCLWYLAEGGGRCEDCSLWTDAERRERYERVLASLD